MIGSPDSKVLLIFSQDKSQGFGTIGKIMGCETRRPAAVLWIYCLNPPPFHGLKLGRVQIAKPRDWLRMPWLASRRKRGRVHPVLDAPCPSP
jgi:hypothetical protein